jgi:hypothetical protein
LKWSLPAAWFHDLCRLISQGSDHDDWGDRLLAAIKIRPEIINDKHQPVPTEGNVTDFDPEEFDSPAQKIVRLVDVGGKVDLETGSLRESIQALQAYSKSVQLTYLNQGDPAWIGLADPEQAIENYTQKEAKALASAIEYLKSLGVDWFEVIKQVNRNWQTIGPFMAEMAR